MEVIPTVDLSPFLKQGDEDGRKKAIDVITKACSEYGFFQIVNHGVPVELMTRAIHLSKTFFSFSEEEKLKSKPGHSAPLPAGYTKLPDNSPEKKEYLLMFPPNSICNIYPDNPIGYKEVLEEVFSYMEKTGSLLEGIVNECLGLPPGFLEEYNHDRNWDFLSALHYLPSTEEDNIGITEHEDGNSITFVFQDDSGGLEVRKDGEWIPVTPVEGNIVVNISDVIQVLSNNKFKSSTHRVVRQKGSRYSYAFFYNLHGDKWVEPLPEFTTEIGEPPKYRGFFYKEYQALRMRNKTHPPERPEDVIHITHYLLPGVQNGTN